MGAEFNGQWQVLGHPHELFGCVIGRPTTESALTERPAEVDLVWLRRVALIYAATLVVGLAVHQAGRSDLISSPKRVLAHPWEGG